MTEPQYRLVFRGKFLPGISPDEAIANLAGLFQVSAERIEALLANLPATIKRKLDVDAGNRYLEALAEAGVITHLEPENDGWNGAERRQRQRRVSTEDRRANRRDLAIVPDRRQRGRRRDDHD
jgi:hypothetical protein